MGSNWRLNVAKNGLSNCETGVNVWGHEVKYVAELFVPLPPFLGGYTHVVGLKQGTLTAMYFARASLPGNYLDIVGPSIAVGHFPDGAPPVRPD